MKALFKDKIKLVVSLVLFVGIGFLSGVCNGAEVLYVNSQTTYDPEVKINVSEQRLADYAADILMVDPLAKKVIHRFRFGDIIRDVVFSNDRTKAYVAVGGRVTIIDLVTNAKLDSIDFTGIRTHANRLILDEKNGRLFCVISTGSPYYTFYTVDLATRSIINESREGDGYCGRFPFLTMEGVMVPKRENSGKMSIIDLPSGNPMWMYDLNLTKWSLFFATTTPKRDKLILLTGEEGGNAIRIIDITTRQTNKIDILKETGRDSSFRGKDITADGRLLYVGTLKSLLVIDLEQGILLRDANIPVNQMALSEDGSKLYKPLQQNGIDVVSTSSFKVIAHIDIPAEYIYSRTCHNTP